MRKQFYTALAAGISCILSFLYQPAHSQTVLHAGDIAVLGWNSDDTYPNQRWAALAIVNIAANTQIIFTDNGYDGTTSNFRAPSANDGYLTWTTPSLITAGTVIYGTNNTVNGSTTGVSGQLGQPGSPGFGFSGAGDQLIIYQGTSGTASGATFIYALNTGTSSTLYTGVGTWTPNTTAVTSDVASALPPGLTNGVTAVALTNNVGNTSSGTGALGSPNYGFNDMYYGGTTTGTRSTILAAIANPSNWVGSNTTPANLQSGGVYPTNTFTLPVSLLSFTAEQAAGETVQLKWSTVREESNDHFTIERSTDGTHFIAIATIPGSQTTNLTVNYSYTDKNPDPGTNYYRLSQTDLNGTHQILGLKTVSLQEQFARLWPNPVTTAVDATFNAGIWKSIGLYNSTGQLLQTVTVSPVSSHVQFQMSGYESGTYFIVFTGNDDKKRMVKKIMKTQ